MSLYIQNFRPRCLRCYNAGWMRRDKTGPTWNNVHPVAMRGEGIVCECRTCGFRSVRYSKSARRAWEQHQAQEQGPNT